MRLTQTILSLTCLFSAVVGISARYGYRQSREEQSREMICMVNRYREENGMPPVYYDDRLMEAAMRHSDDQAYNSYMSHYGSNGGDFSDRSEYAGYYGHSGAENVAWNQRTVHEVMITWINSPDHEVNLVSRNRCFGYGEVNLYWTQVFGNGDYCSSNYLPDCSDIYL